MGAAVVVVAEAAVAAVGWVGGEPAASSRDEREPRRTSSTASSYPSSDLSALPVPKESPLPLEAACPAAQLGEGDKATGGGR